MVDRSPIPAAILTGFLGAGKTSLLNTLLKDPMLSNACVIINEFGEIGIDHLLVEKTDDNIIELAAGCLCCTIRGDLINTIAELLAKRDAGEIKAFDRILIETTGLADPGPVAQTFFMDEEIAEQYLLDSILTLVDAKHAQTQLDDRQEARRQIGFADQIFISKTDLVAEDEVQALKHRLTHMNPRAPQKAVHFGEVAIKDVFDLRGFNLNAKLDIDPDFLKEDDHAGHDHEHGEHCDHPSHAAEQGHHHAHDDDVKSFVFRSDKPFSPAKLEDFLGAIVNIYGPRMLRYKGVLNMEGTERKVIFQGVHQLMGSDLGPAWAEGETKISKMVFIGIDLPKDIFTQGLEQCLV